MRRSIALVSLWCAAASAAAIPAAEQKELEAILGREIVGQAAVRAEVERYCEAKVPRMATYANADQWQAEADRLRAAVLEKIVFRGEAARWRDAPVRVEWLDTLPGGPGYRIKKLRYEALPGMWIPALLYEPEKLAGKVPVAMNVHGHSGPIGKAEPPQQIRCINQAKRGILALNVDWIGMGQLSSPGFFHAKMNQLDLCGTSGLAPFYLSMKRGLDVLLGLEHADPERVAVTGLSGGGWQTIVISSLDTRVKLAAPVAGYSSFRTRTAHAKDLGDPEQTPNDLATLVDYTHLTAMLAPRAAMLIYNSKDNCCFESGYALPPLMEAARPIYTLFGKQTALQSHVNDDPGTHNYEIDNRQAFYQAIGDTFYAGDASFDAREIPCPSEVRTREELLVDLPAKNEDFNTLAAALAKSLPRANALPADRAAAQAWQEAARGRLREVVRAKDFTVQATRKESEEKAGLKITYWKLALGSDWTVPAVELEAIGAALAASKPVENGPKAAETEAFGQTPRRGPRPAPIAVAGTPDRTAILLADGGRRTAAAEAARLLASGYRVLAVDPLNVGESAVDRHGWLMMLLVAAVGDRPLGVQASQLAAVARWVSKEHPGEVSLMAVGQRCGVCALVAGGLEPEAIAAIELRGSLGSLKEMIEENRAYNAGNGLELFCFGLLEAFDIRQLTALAAPRPVRFLEARPRAKTEMESLFGWYRLLGWEHDPVR